MDLETHNGAYEPSRRAGGPVTIESGIVVRSVAWSFVESLTLVVLSFATLLVIARLLGPADYGVAAAVVVTIQLLNVAVEGLFSEALVQRADLQDGHVKAAMRTSLVVAALLIVMCWVSAGPAAVLYGEPRLAPLLRATSFLLLFSAYSGVKIAMIRRAFAFRQLAMRTLLARLAGCATGLGMAFLGYGPWSIVAQSIVAAAGGAFALWYMSPRSAERSDLRRPFLRDLVRFAAPWLANEMIAVSAPRLYQVLAAYLFGSFQFGLLGMAFRITDTLRELLGYVANSVGLPVFARVQHDPSRLGAQFLKATATLGLFALPGFCGFAICAKTIVVAVLGVAWLPCVPLMQMLAIGAGASLVSGLCATSFAALGQPARPLLLNLASVVLSLACLAIVASGGIVAASLLWLIRQIVTAITLMTMCNRVLLVRWRDIGVALRAPVCLAVVLSLVLWVLDTVLLNSFDPVARLAILAMAGCATTVAGIAIAQPQLARVVLAQFSAVATRT